MKSCLKNYLAGLLCAVFAPAAHALTQEITAVFTPDPANPLKNEFINTTPISGFCADFGHTICKHHGYFSIEAPLSGSTPDLGPGVPVIYAGHTNPREGVMYKVPSEWRAFQVTHTRTGEVETVQMRISGIGQHTSTRPDFSVWPSSSWFSAPPCRSTGLISGIGPNLRFFWIVPEDAGACNKRAPIADITRFAFSKTEYAYALKTPNPLSMSSGEYTGSLEYSIGPGGDFDFGDVVIADDKTMTFNFTLNVQHALKVEVPPGGNRVELLPQGGWQAWLQRNRRPERLFRDQTFNISASSRFKMQLECQHHDGGNTCSLYEPLSGHAVPLNISVSLPNGLTDPSGQPVSRRPLLRDGSGTELFQPGFYVERRPGTLHFEISREEVEKMLDGDNKTYRGNVTVVWDSEV
nr:hypothetical protein [Pseudomonas sp. Sample_10]